MLCLLIPYQTHDLQVFCLFPGFLFTLQRLLTHKSFNFYEIKFIFFVCCLYFRYYVQEIIAKSTVLMIYSVFTCFYSISSYVEVCDPLLIFFSIPVDVTEFQSLPLPFTHHSQWFVLQFSIPYSEHFPFNNLHCIFSCMARLKCLNY